MDLQTAFTLLTVTTAGYFDLRFHRVPNWLVAATALLSVVWHTSLAGPSGLWSSVSGLLLGVVLLFPLFLLRGMGAGDVKFFGALGAAVTYDGVLPILAIALFVGAGMAVYVVKERGSARQTVRNLADVLGRLLQGRVEPHPVVGIDTGKALLVPFTFAVAVATWLVVLSGWRWLR
jgi:prepilin peptidase CpaA